MAFTPEHVSSTPVMKQEVSPVILEKAAPRSVAEPVLPADDQPDAALPPLEPLEGELLLKDGTEAQESPLVQEVEALLGKEIDAYVKERLPDSEMGYIQRRNVLARELVQRRGKMSPEDIVRAIESWLKALPGILSIYLEQAAANKTRELEQLFTESIE